MGKNNGYRIAGGSEAGPNEFPWAAQIQGLQGLKGSQCGGVLIGKSFLLTAQHCTLSPDGKTELQVSDNS